MTATASTPIHAPASSPARVRVPPRAGDRWLLLLLVVGVAVRVGVFFTCSPFNKDRHWQVIRWIAVHHALPTSELLGQSYHPPLYHALMAPLATKGDDAWDAVQAASLAFSSLNLWLIYRLLWRRRDDLFPQRGVAILAMALAAVLPEYVMYGSFISNDTLTILLGTILTFAMLRCIDRPTNARLAILAFVCGLGLLTKGTFILTGAALTVFVAMLLAGRRMNARAMIARLAMFCLIWSIVGCYKYVENVVHLGRPIVHNLDGDPEWARPQKGVWKGLRTLVDVNPLPIIRQPILNWRDFEESYPQMLYATFWYPHIPDSSFRGNIIGYAWAGSILFAVGIVPAIVFLLGCARALGDTWTMLRRRIPIDDATGAARAARAARVGSLLLLLSNLAVVMAAAVRYDVWSCLQSRLCFQSMLPMLILFASGFGVLSRARRIRQLALALSWLAVPACALYFLIEFGLKFGILLPGPQLRY